MIYIFKKLIPIVLLFTFFGCGDNETIESSQKHFQGRDCMLCHNMDLAESSHLSLAGSLFVSESSDIDDIGDMCDQKMYVRFVEDNGSIAWTNEGIAPNDAAGWNGQGNIFTLLRDALVPNGSFNIQLVGPNGLVVAKSSSKHTFSNNYEPFNGEDSFNRYSCNACHHLDTSTAPGLIYVQQNISECRNDLSSVSADNLFNKEIYDVLNTQCGSCHQEGNVGSLNSNFDIYPDKAQTQTDIRTFLLDLNTPENSRLIVYPATADHANTEPGGGIQWDENNTSYQKVLYWTQKVAQTP